MAKAKLLFVLVIIFIFRIFPVFGEDKEDDIDWQDRISKEAIKMNMEQLKGLLEAETVVRIIAKNYSGKETLCSKYL